MDSLINSAARALSAGDPLGALDRVALRDDPPALVLRGIAMAQLGDLSRSTTLLRQAARELATTQPVAHARCTLALAEVALAGRQLDGSAEPLDAAIDTLAEAGDATNATHGRLVRIRRCLLRGEVDVAAANLDFVHLEEGPPRQLALASLIAAEVHVRRLDAKAAAGALATARTASARSGIGPLIHEVEAAIRRLHAPAARRRQGAEAVALTLAEVQALPLANVLLVDGCRRRVAFGAEVRPLSGRPVLFSLLARLARDWPASVSREELIGAAFGPAKVDDSWRARLRVEIGRLRKISGPMASFQATKEGYRIEVEEGCDLVLLEPPVDGPHAAIVALLSDGATWSTSALALALGVSARTMQRALADLREAGTVQSRGKGRARRWVLVPAIAFTTALLLPGLAGGG